MSAAPPGPAASERIKQKRGRETYDALVRTAFELLADREFESITVAELAQSAGYSVGAFYARFTSKDEFFDALIDHHIRDRAYRRNKLFESLPDGEWIDRIIADTVDYYWQRRHFWRAALVRSMHDPAFWTPIRQQGHDFATSFIERIAREANRRLTKPEQTNVRFAMQIALGTINNTIINQPGPVFMGEKQFVKNLSRAFRLVSGYDDIIAAGNSSAGPGKRKQPQ